MRLEEANYRLNEISGLPFRELFSPEDLVSIIMNKGKTGQLLELILGLPLSNSPLDFDDGELKTNKCDSSGKPLETIFICQIDNLIDDLITEKLFTETHLYEKIKNILYVPVCKMGSPLDWMFLPSIHVDIESPQFYGLFDIWQNDYYTICEMLKNHIETSRDGYIHTSNGIHLQVRSKDQKPYRPIYSNIYGRAVSNKNHAFYFQKQFVYDIRLLNR